MDRKTEVATATGLRPIPRRAIPFSIGGLLGMMMFLAAFAAVAVPGAAGAGHWELMGHDSDGTLFLDARTIRTRGHTRILWDRVVYPSQLGDGSCSRLYRMQLDCNDRSIAILSVAAQNREGRTISTQTYPPDPRPVVPATMWETMLDRVCTPRN
jgi:hypothetical protein